MIKIASYNVNSIRSRTRLIRLWLEHRNHDIDMLCMQEIKATREQFPFEFFNELGFQCQINPQKHYNGTGICSKFPALDTTIETGDEILDAQSRFIYQKYPGFHLINIYAPHGDLPPSNKFDFKIHWYERLLIWINSRFNPQKDKIILCGDFNVTFNDRDVYDPVLLNNSIGTLPEERAKLHALIQWGFLDAFRLIHPDKQQFTWWDYQGAKIWKNQGLRIDHILITTPLKENLMNVEVDLWPRRKNKIKPSDHAPIIASFKNLI